MLNWFINFWNKPVVQMVFISVMLGITVLLLWFAYNLFTIIYWLHTTLSPK